MGVYSGPLYGMETWHQWSSGLTLNAGGMPRIVIEKIVGLHALPEADDFRASRTEQPGEIIYPSFARGKTITYNGTIYANSWGNLRTWESTMYWSFWDRSNEGNMNVGGAYRFYARPLALEMDDEQTVGPHAIPYPYQRPFVLSLRLSDPNYYDA